MRKLYLFLIATLFIQVYGNAQQLAPAIEWSKCFGGSKVEKANTVIRTLDNGFLVVGSSFSNDGDVTGHHGSTDSSDAWVVKISSTGNLVWQRSFGGTGTDVFTSVTATSDGNYVCVGKTYSNNGDVSGNHGGYFDLWVVKIDGYGNLLWQKTLGGSGEERAGNVREFSDGTLAIIGSTSSNDGDVSGLHFNGSNYPPIDVWVVRLSNTGTLLSQVCLGGSMDDEGQDIIESANGAYIISCQMNSQDGNLGMPGGNTPAVSVVKLNASNVMIWKYMDQRIFNATLERRGDKCFVSYSIMYCYPANVSGAMSTRVFTDNPSATTPPTSQVFNAFSFCAATTAPSVTGYWVEGVDRFATVSDGINISVATSDNPRAFPGAKGGLDGFIASSTTGNTENWKKFIGGSGTDQLVGVAALNETELLVAGYTNSNNGDVNGNHGGYDFWVAKLGSINLIKGTVFGDFNLNGIKDANESFINNILVQSSKGSIKATSSTFSGEFINSVDTGTYSTTVLSPSPYYTAVPALQSSTFTSYNNSDSLSFALQPLPGKRDYAVFAAAVTPLRPGFDVDYVISYRNDGTDTLTNRTVKFIKDGRLQFLSASPAQTSISGDTITWVIASLAPRASGYITLHLKAAAPPTLNIHDTLSVKAIIDTTGDLNKSNNTAVVRQQPTGSYDPNDKQEVHGDTLFKHEYDAGDYLTYTIRFQNTGTDTAFNIVVKDTLSNRLDSNTLEMISASHAYTLSIKDGKYCAWTFSNILLVDSNRNEPLSHGYITYRIKPKTGLLMHDAILNSASIYFDFNEPVKTNTQQTALKPTPVTLPQQPTIAGMQTSYCKNLPAQKAKITNLPATVSGVTVSVDLDDEPLSIAADSTFTFNVSTLAPGSHVIQVMYINTAGSKVAASTFTVTAVAVPDVNVSASTTNVLNLSVPVTVTASNAAGGGTDPLYTFAKDRSITTILQAESNSSTLTIDPNNLTIGNNWIYVRMKSSATCYSAQTNTDSINVRRDQTTGIVDIDNPSQIINVYPNPFKTPVTISGLSAQKKYIVTITNLQGQQVYNRKFNNRSSIELPAIHGASGVYWLTLYDATRQRSLGSVKLIKE